ncbi:hypothetical protein ASO20_02815 [Mycoplasma sp. (ex Biomphalaria glabrata)]|nr:hypothetical protein ASO20_02815 [Mycoplasma sp. (ex Biomphalaria glabrata)]
MDAFASLLGVIQTLAIILIIALVILTFFLPFKFRIFVIIIFGILLLVQALLPITGHFKDSFLFFILHGLHIVS